MSAADDRTMRNITISLDEKVARWVRVWAAEHDTSVSRFVGDLLQARMESEQSYQRAMKAFLARRPRELKTQGRYPSRDELHERAVLR
jgi:plasmid stability protein